MYKIAILGSENSHADIFMGYIIKENLYPDIEVVGVYSEDKEATDKQHEEFGVYVAKSYDEFVGKVDGVIITARHGDDHYKFAKPYISSGIPMFIDKPVTISEKEAAEFKAELMENNVKVCGGSCLQFADGIKEVKEILKNEDCGEMYGAFFRAPVSLKNDFGNFYFYSQHLAQMMVEVFGFFPISVKAYQRGNVINCVVKYDDFDVSLMYTNGSWEYWAGVNSEKQTFFKKCTLDNCFSREFEVFNQILTGGEQPHGYDEFFAPVYILNAIDRAVKSGNEEIIKRG